MCTHFFSRDPLTAELAFCYFLFPANSPPETCTDGIFSPILIRISTEEFALRLDFLCLSFFCLYSLIMVEAHKEVVELIATTSVL